MFWLPKELQKALGFSCEGGCVKPDSFSVIILMEEILLLECWQKAIIKGTQTWSRTFYFKTKLILADTVCYSLHYNKFLVLQCILYKFINISGMCLCQTGPFVKIHFPWITIFFQSSQNLINWKYFFAHVKGFFPYSL